MHDPHVIPYRWKLAALAAVLLILATLTGAAWLIFSNDGPCASEAHLADLCGPGSRP